MMANGWRAKDAEKEFTKNMKKTMKTNHLVLKQIVFKFNRKRKLVLNLLMKLRKLKFTKENGIMMFKMDSVLLSTSMEINMKENGRMEKEKVKGLNFAKVIGMKANGKIIIKLDGVNFYIKMELYMKEILKIEKLV